MDRPIDPTLFQENERFGSDNEPVRYFQFSDLALHAGGHLDQVTVAYQTWGALNSARSNAVLVCHALSGDSNPIGWWSRVVGPEQVINPSEHFIIGVNALGGCAGSSGPSSLASDGKPYGSRFPAITVQDMAACHIRLLAHLGIDGLLMACGGSMGGMQALEVALQLGDRVRLTWLTASAHRHNAMQIGFNEAARQAIMRDPKWRGGDYPLDDGPFDGLAVSRMIGHLSFLSSQAFEAKFGRQLQDKVKLDHVLSPEFQVESYLNYQGDKFTKRFDANSFLTLSKAIDWYEATDLSRARSKFLLTSFSSDWLYTSDQSGELTRLLRDAGCSAEHMLVDLPFGHDSFLLDGEIQTQLLHDALLCL